MSFELLNSNQSSPNEGDIFYADGNVFARSNNLILKTDKLVYNSSDDIVFTAPTVPTGIKTGVSISE